METVREILTDAVGISKNELAGTSTYLRCYYEEDGELKSVHRRFMARPGQSEFEKLERIWARLGREEPFVASLEQLNEIARLQQIERRITVEKRGIAASDYRKAADGIREACAAGVEATLGRLMRDFTPDFRGTFDFMFTTNIRKKLTYLLDVPRQRKKMERELSIVEKKELHRMLGPVAGQLSQSFWQRTLGLWSTGSAQIRLPLLYRGACIAARTLIQGGGLDEVVSDITRIRGALAGVQRHFEAQALDNATLELIRSHINQTARRAADKRSLKSGRVNEYTERSLNCRFLLLCHKFCAKYIAERRRSQKHIYRSQKIKNNSTKRKLFQNG